jgi:hypothetical protein
VNDVPIGATTTTGGETTEGGLADTDGAGSAHESEGREGREGREGNRSVREGPGPGGGEEGANASSPQNISSSGSQRRSPSSKGSKKPLRHVVVAPFVASRFGSRCGYAARVLRHHSSRGCCPPRLVADFRSPYHGMPPLTGLLPSRRCARIRQPSSDRYRTTCVRSWERLHAC